MPRQKKIKNIHSEEKKEDVMTPATIDENKVSEQALESMEIELDRVRNELEKAKIDLEEKKKQIQLILPEQHKEKVNLPSIAVKGAALKENIARQKKFDNQMITGKFMNRRVPGQIAKLCYLKYEDDPVKWYTLHDGQTYTIPRGFVDQINDHYYSPRFIQNTEIMDPENPTSTIAHVDTSNKKYAFVPVNF